MSAGAPGNKLSDAQRFDWLRLWRSKNIGPRTFWTLLHRYGSAGAALATLLRLMPRGRPATRLPRSRISSASSPPPHDPAPVSSRWARRNIRRIWATSMQHHRLSQCVEICLFQRPAVAIVGSRNASAVGLAFAERLTRGLADAGAAVSEMPFGWEAR
jgi:DNA processing protein